MLNRQGMTLVEVLIALTLITLLSVAFLRATITALAASQEATLRETALVGLQDAAERLRANQLTWASAELALQQSAEFDCYQQQCSAQQIAQADWHQLQQRLHKTMPDGTLHLRMPCRPGAKVGCLLVTWRGAELDACLDDQAVASELRAPGCQALTFWLPG